MSKNLDPNILPEKQYIEPLIGNEISQEKPQIGQGRTGMRRRRPLPLIKLLLRHQNCQRKFLKYQIKMRITNQADFTTPVQPITNSNVEATHRRPLIKDIPFYPDPTYRPPP